MLLFACRCQCFGFVKNVGVCCRCLLLAVHWCCLCVLFVGCCLFSVCDFVVVCSLCLSLLLLFGVGLQCGCVLCSVVVAIGCC